MRLRYLNTTDERQRKARYDDGCKAVARCHTTECNKEKIDDCGDRYVCECENNQICTLNGCVLHDDNKSKSNPLGLIIFVVIFIIIMGLIIFSKIASTAKAIANPWWAPRRRRGGRNVYYIGGGGGRRRGSRSFSRPVYTQPRARRLL